MVHEFSQYHNGNTSPETILLKDNKTTFRKQRIIKKTQKTLNKKFINDYLKQQVHGQHKGQSQETIIHLGNKIDVQNNMIQRR